MPIMSYEHMGEGIEFEEVEWMRAELSKRILAVMKSPQTDSPVFMHLPDLPPMVRRTSG